MSVNKYYIFILFLSLITPWAFMVNKYVFVGLIITELILLVNRIKKSGNRLAVAFLYATIFSGISIAGLKLYDWVIIVAFVWFLVEKRGNFRIPGRILPFLFLVLLNAIIHYTGNTVVIESLRYLICIILVVITMELQFDFNEISRELMCICLSNLYFAIMVFMLMNAGRIIKHGNSLILVNRFIVQRINKSDFIGMNLYLYTNETRLNGFFSDPNKYMVFCFAMLFMIEVFVVFGRYKMVLISFVLVSAIISLSRTALIGTTVYLVLKGLYAIRQRKKSDFLIIIYLTSAVAVFLLVIPKVLNELVDYLYVISTEILGRKYSLKFSSSFHNDNRMRIWRMALKYIEAKPVLGYGWLSNEYLLPYPTHNSILELLLDGGVITLIAYFYMFLPLIRHKRWDVMISCYLVSSLLLDLANYRMWFFLLGLALCENVYKKYSE